MVIHKAEKCNINNVSENKIHDDTSGYNSLIIFFIITVITAVVYAITVYPAACSRESVITNKDTETKFKMILRDKYIDDVFLENVSQNKNSWNSLDVYDSNMKSHKIIWKEVK